MHHSDHNDWSEGDDLAGFDDDLWLNVDDDVEHVSIAVLAGLEEQLRPSRWKRLLVWFGLRRDERLVK